MALTPTTRARGSNARAVGSFETTPGTVPPNTDPWFTIPFVSHSLGEERPLIESDLLGQGREMQDPTPDVATNDGDIVVPVDVKNIGNWLKLFFGAPVTTGAGPYTHVFKSGAAALPAMSIEIGAPEVPSFSVNRGARGNQLRVGLSRSGLLNATCTLSVPVRPVRPVAAYLGGKRNLSARLVSIIDQMPHKTYAEPFVGMGGVFLRRTRKPPYEVINDISGDVATLFRVLQEHYPYFVEFIRWRFTSRAEFERLLAIPGDRLTDIQRAARFLHLQRMAFGGKVTGQNFGVAPQQAGRFDVTKLEPILADVHDRLAGVVIEQLPYAGFIRRYDRPETLFYLDPPYWGNEADYGEGVFGRDDFARLAEQLSKIRGRFILSINDTPGARDVFHRFAIEAVETTYSAPSGAPKKAGELIVTGPLKQ